MSFRKPVTITRQSGGAYSAGVWVPGSQYTLTIKASIQPLSDEDAKTLPEGVRVEDSIKLYTDQDLVIDDTPDLVTWRSNQYKLTSKSVRQMDVIPHYRYFATKV